VQFDFGLWTRKIVRALIRREFGIDYTPQYVGKILKSTGFSPQRPVWQALERDLERRRQWTEEAFPAPKKRADQEDARIYFADKAYSRTGRPAKLSSQVSVHLAFERLCVGLGCSWRRMGRPHCFYATVSDI
jgi:hypothetical protein